MKKMIKTIAFGTLVLIAGLGLSACQTEPTYNGYRTSSYSEAAVYQGRVIDIQQEVNQHQNNGGGAVAGAIVGGLLGSTIGHGNGRVLGTVGGAVAGGFAGNAIENNTGPNYSLLITIRADDGRVTQLNQPNSSLRIGDRVQVTEQGGNIQVLRLAY